jgi:5'-nucleotidase
MKQEDKMRILVSNDDGVYSPGLAELYESLLGVGDVTVIAPDRDCSAASHSLTLSTPIRIRELENGFISVSGTPADCVYVGLRAVMKEQPNMVISGINSGANLGDDVLYSGTVAAAMEGRFLGFPSIAVSLAGEHTYYETAGRVVQILVRQLMRHPLPSDTILNVNIPNVPFEQLSGYKVTRLGRRHPSANMIEDKDPRGKTIYWVGAVGGEQDAGPDTDFHAINNNYVSITPLETDITRYKVMSDLEFWSRNISLAGLN